MEWLQSTHRVGSVGHGVERSKGEGELVDDVVVGVELGLDEFTEDLFRCRAIGGRRRK